MKLKIALDCDDVIFDWRNSFENKYHCKLKDSTVDFITSRVNDCKYNKNFWVNLPVIERPDFVPYVYCTKRINPKKYTLGCFIKNKLPIRPIYQIKDFQANKADYIRTVCDILIDDSFDNIEQCINSGFPALLITREHNKHINTPYRINHLKYNEIVNKYNELFQKI